MRQRQTVQEVPPASVQPLDDCHWPLPDAAPDLDSLQVCANITSCTDTALSHTAHS